MGAELIHTRSLVHDDIGDDETLRPGGLIVHVVWNRSPGIVADDLLYAQAFTVVTDTAASTDVQLACTRL